MRHTGAPATRRTRSERGNHGKEQKKAQKVAAAIVAAPDVRHMRKSKEVRRLFRESIRPYGNERAGKLEKMGLQNV